LLTKKASKQSGWQKVLSRVHLLSAFSVSPKDKKSYKTTLLLVALAVDVRLYCNGWPNLAKNYLQPFYQVSAGQSSDFGYAMSKCVAN